MAEARDKRLLENPPIEEGSMSALLVWTKNQLRPLAARGCSVDKIVQMSRRQSSGMRALLCGDRSGAEFVRRDGLRCHFEIVLVETDAGLELDTYAFHVDAPAGWSPAFLRWEYAQNRKDGVDAVKEPLAHLHPGHDDVRLPAPVFSPKELLTVFLGLEAWG